MKAKNLLAYGGNKDPSRCLYKIPKKDDFPYHKHSTLLKNIQAEKKRQRIFGVISADVMKISKYENAVRKWIKIVATNDGTIIAIEMRDRTADIMNAIGSLRYIYSSYSSNSSI